MKLRFLGTAAAEGWPAIFCECDGCVKARKNGGKDIRHRCSYMIDDDTLVDYGPDTYAQCVAYGLDMTNVTRMFISHGHSDHFVPRELDWRSKGYCQITKNLDLYANQHVLDLLSKALYKPLDEMYLWHMTAHCVLPGDTVVSGDVKATAVLANHAGPEQIPLNYIIERGGKTLFIGTDSGLWCDESWQILERFKLDAAIIECTCGIKFADYKKKHLGANGTLEARDEMQKRGILKTNAQVVTSHFSHNCMNMHEEFENFFVPKGIQVAYDGLVLDI